MSPDTGHYSTEYRAEGGTSNAFAKRTAMTALLLGLLPTILNTVAGDNQHWTEICVALSVSIWLYYSLKGKQSA